MTPKHGPLMFFGPTLRKRIVTEGDYSCQCGQKVQAIPIFKPQIMLHGTDMCHTQVPGVGTNALGEKLFGDMKSKPSVFFMEPLSSSRFLQMKDTTPSGFAYQGRGGQRGLGHNLLMQFSNLGGSKMEIFETVFLYILIIQNDQISYVKHVLYPIHVLFTLFGCLDGGKGLGHNLLMQFSTLSSSKMEIFETNFFDALTIHNDPISYANHVLDPLYVFFTLFGCWRRDGGLLNDFLTN